MGPGPRPGPPHGGDAMETKEKYTLSQNEADLPARVLEILQLCKGARNAITAITIARRLGYLNDRKVRIAIQQLVHDGYPIAASVSDPLGYYIVETREEAEAYSLVLRSRATQTFNRMHDFQRAIQNKFGVPFQPVLFGDETQEAQDAA